MQAIHKKTGNIYEVISLDATDCTNERDGTQVVIYRCDGMMFVRERAEFLEKFKLV